jgi:hypothetical protein
MIGLLLRHFRRKTRNGQIALWTQIYHKQELSAITGGKNSEWQMAKSQEQGAESREQ